MKPDIRVIDDSDAQIVRTLQTLVDSLLVAVEGIKETRAIYFRIEIRKIRMKLLLLFYLVFFLSLFLLRLSSRFF